MLTLPLVTPIDVTSLAAPIKDCRPSLTSNWSACVSCRRMAVASGRLPLVFVLVGCVLQGRGNCFAQTVFSHLLLPVVPFEGSCSPFLLLVPLPRFASVKKSASRNRSSLPHITLLVWRKWWGCVAGSMHAIRSEIDTICMLVLGHAQTFPPAPSQPSAAQPPPGGQGSSQNQGGGGLGPVSNFANIQDYLNSNPDFSDLNRLIQAAPASADLQRKNPSPSLLLHCT